MLLVISVVAGYAWSLNRVLNDVLSDQVCLKLSNLTPLMLIIIIIFSQLHYNPTPIFYVFQKLFFVVFIFSQ